MKFDTIVNEIINISLKPNSNYKYAGYCNKCNLTTGSLNLYCPVCDNSLICAEDIQFIKNNSDLIALALKYAYEK